MSYFGHKKPEELSHSTISNHIRGAWFKCPATGKATSLTALLAVHLQAGQSVKIKGAIYRKDNKFIAATQPKTFNSTFSKQWVTFKFASPPTVEAGVDYWLVMWSSRDGVGTFAEMYLRESYEHNKGVLQDITYDSFPKPLVPTLLTERIYNIYCNYTPTEETLPNKGRLYVYAVADSDVVDASFLINGEGPYYTRETGKTLDLTPGPYKIVGNYKGQTDEKTVTIEKGEIYTRTLTFAKMHKFTVVSEPSPINFTFNTELQSTPFVRELVSGTYTLVMPKSWIIGLDEYVFEQWENGSRKPTRTVTLASPQEVTVTATYRLRQIDEAGPINQRQMKDTLQEVVGQGADVSPTNPLPTEDTGTHSNPEKFVQDHKFSSWPIDRAGAVATLLYGVASPATHRRTAGRDITVWWIYFYNHSGAEATVWLESPTGTVITATVQLADNQGVMLNVKPLDVGNQEIFVNASANLVQAQCGGIET